MSRGRDRHLQRAVKVVHRHRVAGHAPPRPSSEILPGAIRRHSPPPSPPPHSLSPCRTPSNQRTKKIRKAKCIRNIFHKSQWLSLCGVSLRVEGTFPPARKGPGQGRGQGRPAPAPVPAGAPGPRALGGGSTLCFASGPQLINPMAVDGMLVKS